MGMAASQARLLSLTARLHDVEYKAQNLQSQKIALATQKDELYQNYCNALDATTFKVSYINNGKETLVDANFNSLCTYNKNRRADYALIDNDSGKVLVTSDIKEAYDRYGSKDKFAFAWAAMGLESNLSYVDSADMLSQIGINGSQNDNYGESYKEAFKYGAEGSNLYMTDVEEIVFSQNYPSNTELANAYDTMKEATDTKEKAEALKNFREVLYEECGEELWEQININKNDSSTISYDMPDTEWSDIKGEFEYYTKLWSAINEAGGCTTIEEQNREGEEGNEWFTNMVNAGMIGIRYIEKNGDTTWDDTSIATSINESYLQEVEADEKALKKAEAEYEHGLDLINTKDSKFDTELSKLETERKAITTEMDSIKQVKDDNIDRTFGIFS